MSCPTWAPVHLRITVPPLATYAGHIRKSRPHDGLPMHLGAPSLVLGGLMSNTSQTFFVLAILQFSLRNGNVCYDVICGTLSYRLLHFLLDCVERVAHTGTNARVPASTAASGAPPAGSLRAKGACDEMDYP